MGNATVLFLPDIPQWNKFQYVTFQFHPQVQKRTVLFTHIPL